MTRFAGIGALALLASLGACGSAEQTADDAAPAADMNMDGPFATSEMDMDTAMKNAIGVDAADSWVKKMIAHHQGAIDMSRIVLGLQPTPDVAKMAQTTIDNQGAEIEALKALAKSGAPDPESARLYVAAMTEMHNAMMAASGANASETYLAKMLAHHRGAVAMSDIALANGATGALRSQIEETRAEQLKEVAMVEATLRGEPMATRAKAASETVPPASVAKPAAPKPAAAKPTPAKADPAPAPEPQASSTCEPEHREAGHC
jgi:uncharacterized protein (DUF305 family)